jgi:hypothetical protein
MAKAMKVLAAANEIGHALLEWPDEDYQRFKCVNRSNELIVTAHERFAILGQLRIHEEEDGGT